MNEKIPSIEKGPQYPEVAQRLLTLGDADQEVRMRVREVWDREDLNHEERNALMAPINQEMAAGDESRTRELSAIIDEIGWPTKSKVGEEAANAAWLLAQHADRDTEFQKKCLALMEAAPPGEVSLEDVAMLTDRVRIREGKPQLYASQFMPEHEGSDTYVLYPVEDHEHVHERRARMGMMPLKEYIEGEERWKKPDWL